jgi:hypothetical protein
MVGVDDDVNELLPQGLVDTDGAELIWMRRSILIICSQASLNLFEWGVVLIIYAAKPAWHFHTVKHMWYYVIARASSGGVTEDEKKFRYGSTLRRVVFSIDSIKLLNKNTQYILMHIRTRNLCAKAQLTTLYTDLSNGTIKK